MKRQTKFGFTLAEVLIVLGIIGVVAALTIPTLMRNYQLKVTETKVKQAYSMVAQAIKLSQVDNGDMSGWNFGTTSLENTDRFMNEYILPYLKTIHTCSKTGYELEPACKGSFVSYASREYILSNGAMISFRPSVYSDKDMAFMVNVNYKNIDADDTYANQFGVEGKDWFYFSVEDGVITPAQGWSSTLDRATALENCKTIRQRCTALFFIDRFKFLPDNPRAK